MWGFGLFLVFGQLFYASVLVGDQRSLPNQANQQQLTNWFIANQNFALLIFAGVILVLLALILVYFQSKAGLILSVKALIERQDTGFRKALNQARPVYHKILLLSFVIGAVTFVLLFILAAPVAYLWLSGYFSRAMMLAAFALAIFIPASISLFFLNTLSAIFITLQKLSLQTSLKASLSLISKKWSTLLVFSVVLWVLALTAFFATLVMVSLILVPFVWLAELAYLQGNIYFGLYVAGLSLATFAFFVPLSIIASFYQTAWVLAYEELVKPIKTDESEQSAVVPEAA